MDAVVVTGCGAVVAGDAAGEIDVLGFEVDALGFAIFGAFSAADALCFVDCEAEECHF